MKRVIAIFLALLMLISLYAATETNETKSVTVKRWERHQVYGFADGTLYDPSGKIASRAHAAGIEAAAGGLVELAEAARKAADMQLEKMYAVTNQIETFTKKIFVQATLYPDLTELNNCWSKTVSEWTDGTNDYCQIFVSRELKVPPVVKRRYTTEFSTNYVEGVWIDFDAPGKMIDGYEGCKEIKFARPSDVIGKNCFKKGYARFGTKENGFDFGIRVFTVDEELPYTGTWTNALGKIWRFNNGVKVGEEQDAIQ